MVVFTRHEIMTNQSYVLQTQILSYMAKNTICHSNFNFFI